MTATPTPKTLHLQLLSIPEAQQALIVPEGPQLTIGAFRKLYATFASSLYAFKIPAQSVVSIVLGNSLEFVTAFLAVTSSGLIASPLNPDYQQKEFEFYLNDIKSKLVVVPTGSVANKHPAVLAARKLNVAITEVHWNGTEVVVELASPGGVQKPVSVEALRPDELQPDPEHIAFVLHTSGTTGPPKAVPLLHKNMLASAQNIIGTYRLSKNDVSYLVMPLFHVHGLMAGFIAPLAAGGSIVIPPKFSAHKFWDEYTKYGANWYTAVPTIHQILLKTPVPDPLPKIRFIRSCSSSLAPSTFRELEVKFKAPVIEAYAMTEACHQMTSNSLPPGRRQPGSVGIGFGVDVVILDQKGRVLPPNKEGEISIRGANVTPGYLHNPKANRESFTAGYFRTGDQGYMDDSGMLYISGRIKELINRGGEKISPIELDGVLLQHPAVSEAVAFGVPDEKYGEQVNAAVVLQQGQKVSEDELKAFVKKHLAEYKVPARIFFTEKMPKTATGKIQRRKLAGMFDSAKAKL